MYTLSGFRFLKPYLLIGLCCNSRNPLQGVLLLQVLPKTGSLAAALRACLITHS